MALSANALSFLVLKALDGGASHGYGVARWIETVTEDGLSVEEGTLYPALHRLEKQGLLESRWGRSEHNRRAKFYRLTEEGRRRLAREQENWVQFAEAMSKVVAVRAEAG